MVTHLPNKAIMARLILKDLRRDNMERRHSTSNTARLVSADFLDGHPRIHD